MACHHCGLIQCACGEETARSSREHQCNVPWRAATRGQCRRRPGQIPPVAPHRSVHRRSWLCRSEQYLRTCRRWRCAGVRAYAERCERLAMVLRSFMAQMEQPLYQRFGHHSRGTVTDARVIHCGRRNPPTPSARPNTPYCSACADGASPAKAPTALPAPARGRVAGLESSSREEHSEPPTGSDRRARRSIPAGEMMAA